MTFDEIKIITDRLDSTWKSMNDGESSAEEYIGVHDEYCAALLTLINEGRLYEYIEWRARKGSRTPNGFRVIDED